MGGGIPGIFTLNNSSVVFLSKLIPGDFFLIPVVQGLMDLEKRRLKGGNLTPVYPDIYMCLEGRCSEDGARGKGLTLKHRRFPLDIGKHIFYCQGDQALAQVAQGGFPLAVLGDIQKLPGHGAAWVAVSR